MGESCSVLVDTFADLVASKMVALVERGAPRDFRDIYMLCQSGQCDMAQCWELWRERQRLAGEDADPRRARLAIRTHLARIEQARPLSQVADLQDERRLSNCGLGLPRSFCMTWQVDGTLYPDAEPPRRLRTLADRVDFIARLCAAWDFGLLPDWETVVEVRRQAWRPAVDRCRLLTSPTYHLLRRWHGLPCLPYLGSIPAYIRDDPNLAYV